MPPNVDMRDVVFDTAGTTSPWNAGTANKRQENRTTQHQNIATIEQQPATQRTGTMDRKYTSKKPVKHGSCRTPNWRKIVHDACTGKQRVEHRSVDRAEPAAEAAEHKECRNP